MDIKNKVQRKRYTLKHKANVVHLIRKCREDGMLIDEACETNGIKRNQFYQWKKYVEAKKKQPEEYLRLLDSKSENTGAKSELADNEQDILRFIFEKRKLGMSVTTRVIIDFVKSIDEKFRQKTESAQWAQIHRFIKAHELELRIQMNGTENRKSQEANVKDEKNQEDDGDEQEECDSQDEMRYLEINGELSHGMEVGTNEFGTPVEECDGSKSNEAIKAERGTENEKRASFDSSLNKTSSITKSRHKTDSKKIEHRRALLEEVRIHTELLIKFEDIIPEKEFKKRKMGLYLALPPLQITNADYGKDGLRRGKRCKFSRK